MSEFASHTDLHMAEGLAFEELGSYEQIGETTILSRDQPTNLDEKSVQPSSPSTAEPLSAHSIPGPTVGTRSTNPQQHSHGFKNATISTTPKPKTTKARQKHARRLSVS